MSGTTANGTQTEFDKLNMRNAHALRKLTQTSNEKQIHHDELMAAHLITRVSRSDHLRIHLAARGLHAFTRDGEAAAASTAAHFAGWHAAALRSDAC